MSDVIAVFDRGLVRRRRDRAAARFAEYDFLFREVGERLVDRLDDVTHRFPFALELGCHRGGLADLLCGRGGIETLVQCDISEAMARGAAEPRPNGPKTLPMVADEENLPFAEGRFDLILSNLGLHWVNDLPGVLVQARRALKPDGLFLATLFGGGTLAELRAALSEAEIDGEGGLSPRVSPFADVRDAAHLLQRAGFALPVADVDAITVSYPDALRLMRDLRGMGESNAMVERRRTPTRRSTLLGAAARYHDARADADGRVPATFQIITLTAWAPHASQQRPLAPGSARASLAEALNDRGET